MSGENNDQFNMLEALAEHAPDVFRHELVAKHLDTTTTSLLWQVSKKLKSAVEATGVFTAGICELEGCEPEVIFKLSLSNKMYLNGSQVQTLEPGEQPSYCGTGTLFHQVNPELVTTVALAKWAKENGAPINLRIAMQAVAVGNIDVVRWMVTDLWPRFPVLDQKMVSMALANNRKDIFLELRAAGCPIDDESVCFMAAHEGHFELMKWLHKDEKYELQDVDLTQVRDTRIMRYLEDNLYTCEGGAIYLTYQARLNGLMTRAARFGNLTFAKWFAEERNYDIPWNGLMLAFALWEDNPCRRIETFDFGFAAWARSRGCPEPTEEDWTKVHAGRSEAIDRHPYEQYYT
jgi:hypothetical protein